MGVDDYIDTEAGIIAAATAAAVSPRARDLFRRGAVYGLAGVLRTGDVALAAARGAVRGARAEAGAGGNGAPTSSRPNRARSQTATQSRGTSRRSAQSSRSKKSGGQARSSRG